MSARAEEAVRRIQELDAEFMDPAVMGNPTRLRELGTERSQLVPIVAQV
ncbi:MAG: hypothetical protein QGG40_07285 [Myxococcota bacterium]|nr:hypothetical protein [Myxococcota bacterium]